MYKSKKLGSIAIGLLLGSNAIHNSPADKIRPAGVTLGAGFSGIVSNLPVDTEANE